MNEDGTSRRSWLVACGSAGVVGLAGCMRTILEEDLGDEGGDGGLAGAEAGDGENGDDGSADGDTDGEEPEDVDDRSIRYGILWPESGPTAEFFSPIADAAALPTVQFDAAGTPLSVETTRADTGGSPERAAGIAEELVADGVPSLTGVVEPDVAVAVAESVAVSESVPFLSTAGATAELTDLGGEYALRTDPGLGPQGTVMADLADERGWETASILHPTGDSLRELASGFRRRLETLGGEVLTETAVEGGRPSPEILEIVHENEPDVLLAAVFPPPEAVEFLTTIYESLGELPTIVPEWLVGELPEEFGRSVDSLVGVAPATGSGFDSFAELHATEYGTDREDLDVWHARAYDASAVQVLANARAGEDDGSAVAGRIREVTEPGGETVDPSSLVEGAELAAAGEDVEYRGASGPVAFDADGDLSVASYDVHEFVASGTEVVDSVEYEA